MVAAVMVTLALPACTSADAGGQPTTDPTPASISPTAPSAGGSPGPTSEFGPEFTSEEQAFAIAEATYLAYIDALNGVDLADPATFEPVFALTTGEFQDAERAQLSFMHGNGWEMTGHQWAQVVDGAWIDSHYALAVCSDVSGTSVVDGSGNSVVEPDLPDVQPVLVIVAPAATSDTGGLIIDVLPRSGEPTCP